MNRQDDTIFNQLREMLNETNGKFNILEEEINIELQSEYFEYSRNHQHQKTDREIIDNKDDIFLEHLPIETRKRIFVELASVNNVIAYRTLEKYLRTGNGLSLRDWAVLAYQESRMLIESNMLGENQVFISTGLGGKKNKLRYNVILITKEGELFNDFRQGRVKGEVTFYLGKSKAELEEIRFTTNYAMLIAMVPINISLGELFEDIIEECNNFGDFLDTNFIITNVKKLTIDEIDSFISQRELEDPDIKSIIDGSLGKDTWK